LFLLDLSNMARLTVAAVKISFTTPPRWRLISQQMYKIGFLSLPVVLMTGATTGAILALQAYYQFHRISMETGIGALVSLSVTNELGPILTSIMVAGRVGAAMAAELATMKVTEQIDALRSLATDPMRYLVAPRFIAGITMIPILTVFSIGMGIVGGYVIAVYLKGINSAFYLSNMYSFTGVEDLMTGIIKSVVFALIIIVVSCNRGFQARGGAEGVGDAATSTVVISSISILISDFFLSNILFAS